MSSAQPLLPPRRWRAEVRAGLEEMIRRHGRAEGDGVPPLATLDWDDTCVFGDVEETLLAELDARDGGDRMATYERLLVQQGMDAAYTFAATALGGRTADDLAALTEEVVDAALAGGSLCLRPEVMDLVAALRAHGWEIWVVSASVEVAIRAVVPRYGLSPDRVIGVRLETAPDGTLARRATGPLTWRQGKVDAIAARIGRMPLFAAGDTLTDLEMLRAARYRLLLDRGVATVRAVAEDEGWWIQRIWER